MSRMTRWMLALGLAFGAGGACLTAQEQAIPDNPASPVTTLRIWLPDALDSAALTSLIDEFQQANEDAQIDLRLKFAGDISAPGTLYHNLRTTRATAPGALPHLTLLRRSDLDFAVREGLLTPFTGAGEAALLEGVLPAAAALGEIEATLFGIPFLLEVQHQAYQPGLTAPESWSLSAVQAGHWRFVFPASASLRLSDLLIAQLAEAGAVNEQGRLAPDAGTLNAIYGFYETGRGLDLFPPETLRAESPGDYLPLLTDGELPAGAVTSSDYLRLLDQGSPLLAAPLPTLNGRLASPLNGWLWVLPTGTPEERALALRFIVWMDEPARQAEYARAVHQIPAQADAFAQWAEGDYGQMIEALLTNGALPPVDLAVNQPALTYALQTGLTQVLHGSSTAAQAVEAILAAGQG